jgi:hypothetical protein
MTAGMAGKLLRERAPEPWTGAENVDGKRAVGYVVDIVVGAAVIMVSLGFAEDVAVGERLTEGRVSPEPTFTSTPPTLRPRRGDAVAAELARTAMRVESFVLGCQAGKQELKRRIERQTLLRMSKATENERKRS